MSRRTERPYQVDGADKLARHSAVRCSAPEIKGPVVQQEFTFLLRDSAFTRDLFFFSCKNTNSVLTRFQYHPGSNLTHLKSNLPLTLRPQGFQIFPAREEAGDARFFRS